MYINTIDLMEKLARQPWDTFIQNKQTMESPQFSTEIEVSPQTQGSTSELQIMHAVTALYEAGIAIAKDNDFCWIAVRLLQDNLIIGELTFQPSNQFPNK